MRKLILMSSIICLTIFSTIIFISCKKETTQIVVEKVNINEQLSPSAENLKEVMSDAKKYQEEVTVYDISKKYYINFNISSDNYDYLKEYIKNMNYSIDVLYIDNRTVSNIDIVHEDNVESSSKSNTTNSITHILVKSSLPNNALGFTLNTSMKKTRASSGSGAEFGFTGMNEYPTLANGITTTNNLPWTETGRVEKWSKKRSYSNYWFKGDALVGGSNYIDNFCIKDHYRIKVQIHFTLHNNYGISFWGSSSC
jgi:hypothetical protein